MHRLVFRHARFTADRAFVAVAARGRCRLRRAAKPKTQPELAEHSLSGLAAQHIVVLPTYSIRVMPGLRGRRRSGDRVDVQRTLDADILAAFDERGLRKSGLPRRISQASSTKRDLRGGSLRARRRAAPLAGAQHRAAAAGAARVAVADDGRAARATLACSRAGRGALRAAGTGGARCLRLVLVDPRAVASDVDWRGRQRFSDRIRSRSISASLAVQAGESRAPFDKRRSDRPVHHTH